MRPVRQWVFAGLTELTVLILFFLSTGAAQHLAILDGEIAPAAGVDRSWLKVSLEGSSGPSQYRAQVSSSGDFELDGVDPGEYTLRVFDRFGNEITSQPVEVGSSSAPLMVRLPEWSRDTPPSGNVSVGELAHKPPSAARKAFARAQKESEAHDYRRAAADLKKAIAADPGFAQAHGNLGIQYARLSRMDEAVAEIRKAIELDPDAGRNYSNLALILLQMHQIPEAETLARRGVDLQRGSAFARMVLGWALANRPEARQAAIPNLEYAARELPEAHRILAELYQSMGQDQLAENETRLYAAASPKTAAK